MLFIERKKAPSKDNIYYGKPDPFINAGLGMFQCNGNCTDYAWCRFRESQNNMLASNKLPTSNAGGWLEKAKKAGFKTGKKAKLGAIVVYKRKDAKKNEGHVAFVEKLGSKITYSSSGYKSYIFKTKQLKEGSNWSSSLIFQGYIYPDVTFDNDDTFENGTYQIIVSKYLRKTAKVSVNKLKVKDCNATIRKLLTSTKLKDNAKFKLNAKVELCDFKKDSKGNTWGRVKNNTVTTWICVYDKTGRQVIKV